jgi:hypothetical protein
MVIARRAQIQSKQLRKQLVVIFGGRRVTGGARGASGRGISIEIRLYRKGTYILGDIHGMDHFCTKLAPRPYNKPRSCVSRIHTPMVMVWFGNA